MARLSRGISARSVSWKLLAPLLALTFILVAGRPAHTQPPPATPEPPPAPPTFELPEVEVAGKRPQLPSTTPASVSVITAEEIARLGALSVADVLRILPEVRVKDSGGPGSFTSVSIRGSASTQVLILLDGVPLAPPISAEAKNPSPTAPPSNQPEVAANYLVEQFGAERTSVVDVQRGMFLHATAPIANKAAVAVS